MSSLNSGCPTYLDEYLTYSSGLGAANNPLAGFTNAVDPDIIPRGAFGGIISIIDVATGVAPVVSTGAAQAASYDITFESTEVLLISPFLLGNEDANDSGIYGITNMNFVFNLGTGNRILRSASSKATGLSCVLQNVVSSELQLVYLTPHASQLLPPRVCVPYYDLPRYITQVGSGPAAGSPAAPTFATISSNSLQLSVLPDKLFIFVRKTLASQTMLDTDSFMPITAINIMFNNQAGILSSSTDQQLFRYSKMAGSNQSFQSFSGKAFTGATGTLGSVVLTSGSLLMLDMGQAVQLNENWFASGSLGNFNLQFNVTVANYSNVDYSSTGNTKLELVLVTMNSGVASFERGTTSIFTGILTKNDVLTTAEQEPYSTSEVKRLVGGSMGDKLKSFGRFLAPKLPKLREMLESSDNEYAKAGASALKHLGYGMSGGKKSRSKLEERLGAGFSRG